jgi:type I restriction-modification system DNA methylase subunit
MFVQSAEFVKEHQGKIDDLSVFGQESNPTTWKMAMMNLAIRGIDADLGSFNADTFFNDLHKDKRFEISLPKWIQSHKSETALNPLEIRHFTAFAPSSAALGEGRFSVLCG